MNRRLFIKVTALAGGVTFGFGIPEWITRAAKANPTDEVVFEPNLYITISSTNEVTVRIFKHEMGQGVATGLPMIVADELGADWATLKTEGVTYSDETHDTGHFETGGSSTITTLWQPLREAAATAREMLITAACAQWSVARASCYTADGFVINRQTEERLTFGELAEAAARVPLPDAVPLKDPRSYRLIGQPVPGRHVEAIVRGQHTYSMDVKVPGMLYAAIVRAPVVGATVRRIDASRALAIPGVHQVLHVPGQEKRGHYAHGVTEGVAVLADSTWAAFQGKQAVDVEWDEGPNQHRSSESLWTEFEQAKQDGWHENYSYGHPDDALAQAVQRVAATYESPYLAHALMEPLNAIAYVHDGQCELWAGSQSLQLTALYIADILGLDVSQVTFHGYPSGGGFGRRFFVDFVAEAALLSQQIQQPVKVVWTREDDIQHGRYHPYQQSIYEAGIDEQHDLSSWTYKGMTTHEWRPGSLPVYAIPHARIAYKNLDTLVNWGAWRSVIEHSNVLGNESFIDEIAHHVQEDPLAFRLRHIEKAWEQLQTSPSDEGDMVHKKVVLPRYLHVLEVLREQTQWGRSLPARHGLGVAVSSHWSGTVCGHVAHVSVEQGHLTIHKVTCAFHCGTVINPNAVRAQVEGSILWALTPVLYGGITVQNGRVQESNFHDYQVVRMDTTPDIDIHLLESADPPGGVGEPAVPPLAPAVLNAIYAATGKRIRKIPVSATDLL